MSRSSAPRFVLLSFFGFFLGFSVTLEGRVLFLLVDGVASSTCKEEGIFRFREKDEVDEDAEVEEDEEDGFGFEIRCLGEVKEERDDCLLDAVECGFPFPFSFSFEAKGPYPFC